MTLAGWPERAAQVLYDYLGDWDEIVKMLEDLGSLYKSPYDAKQTIAALRIEARRRQRDAADRANP